MDLTYLTTMQKTDFSAHFATMLLTNPSQFVKVVKRNLVHESVLSDAIDDYLNCDGDSIISDEDLDFLIRWNFRQKNIDETESQIQNYIKTAYPPSVKLIDPLELAKEVYGLFPNSNLRKKDYLKIVKQIIFCGGYLFKYMVYTQLEQIKELPMEIKIQILEKSLKEDKNFTKHFKLYCGNNMSVSMFSPIPSTINKRQILTDFILEYERIAKSTK